MLRLVLDSIYRTHRFVFVAKISLLTIFLTPAYAAGPVDSCIALLKRVVPTERLERRMSDEDVLRLQTDASSQLTIRTLGEYMNALPIAPILHRGNQNPDFHWLDVGGGAGVAGLQSFISENYESSGYRFGGEKVTSEVSTQHEVTVVSYEDLYFKDLLHNDEDLEQRRLNWRSKLMKISEKQKEAGKYHYLTGRFFEDIPVEEIKKADLITDFFGAFSYSTEKFLILKKMIHHLAPGGKIMIWTQWPFIVAESQNGTAVTENLKQYLDKNPIPGVQTLGGPGLLIEPTSETLPHLGRLESRLKLIKVLKDYPPRFYYRAD